MEIVIRRVKNFVKLAKCYLPKYESEWNIVSADVTANDDSVAKETTKIDAARVKVAPEDTALTSQKGTAPIECSVKVGVVTPDRHRDLVALDLRNGVAMAVHLQKLSMADVAPKVNHLRIDEDLDPIAVMIRCVTVDGDHNDRMTDVATVPTNATSDPEPVMVVSLRHVKFNSFATKFKSYVAWLKN